MGGLKAHGEPGQLRHVGLSKQGCSPTIRSVLHCWSMDGRCPRLEVGASVAKSSNRRCGYQRRMRRHRVDMAGGMPIAFPHFISRLLLRAYLGDGFVCVCVQSPVCAKNSQIENHPRLFVSFSPSGRVRGIKNVDGSRHCTTFEYSRR